jgi:hypothetical protein
VNTKAAILRSLKRGEVITNSLSDMRRFRTLKPGSRTVEVAEENGIRLNRDWKRLPGGRRVRAYRRAA